MSPLQPKAQRGVAPGKLTVGRVVVPGTQADPLCAQPGKFIGYRFTGVGRNGKFDFLFMHDGDQGSWVSTQRCAVC
ncbi:hypothetical protein GCM10007242_33720 [Pigmentiphaga litoralis]|nr:hypothetical protein GCM10007242_33720 [Pigmentiphaga litoralis]